MVTCKQMKELESLANAHGLSYYHMMENAGMAAAQHIYNNHSIKGKSISIFCGKGNNGGDGYVVARVLFGFGGKITIIKVDGPPATTEAMANYDLCMEMGIPMIDFYKELTLPSSDLIVDAIYGTGFHGDLSPSMTLLFTLLEKGKAPIISLDLPSGLSGDNDDKEIGKAITASETIIFHDEKPIHNNPFPTFGRKQVMDIGITKILAGKE